MGSFKFKSSGKTTTEKVVETLLASPTPIGIKTPLRIGDKEIFQLTYNLAEQVHDNLRNLLLTNWGERVCFYDFGANLFPLTSEIASQNDFDAEATQRISAAVSKWMSYINLEDYVSSIDYSQNNGKGLTVISITITYSISALNVSKKSLQITLYAI
jgi:phage baseplate assembly protein W